MVYIAVIIVIVILFNVFLYKGTLKDVSNKSVWS